MERTSSYQSIKFSLLELENFGSLFLVFGPRLIRESMVS